LFSQNERQAPYKSQIREKVKDEITKFMDAPDELGEYMDLAVKIELITWVYLRKAQLSRLHPAEIMPLVTPRFLDDRRGRVDRRRFLLFQALEVVYSL